MGLNEVKHAIREKTKTEVAAILDSGKQEADRIIGEAKAQVKQKQTEHASLTQEMLEALERKEQAAAQFNRKTVVLSAKRKAIDATFEQATAKLAEMNGQERAKLLSTLAQHVGKSTAIKTIRCNTKDVATLGKLFPGASIVADANISGGFLADDASGDIRLDYTYETMLEGLREEMLSELTVQLFGK